MRTLFREDRGKLATACLAHATRNGALGLILYDVTPLHFQAENEDSLRKVGMSKERRVDPQIQVGLLVDPTGFPLEVHCFEGNTAETSTLLPVLEASRGRHEGADLVVVADAGRLSAKNMNAIEDAESFIVGSRISKAPTTSPRTSTATATRSPTDRSSNPPGSWAQGWPPAAAASYISTASPGTNT